MYRPPRLLVAPAALVIGFRPYGTATMLDAVQQLIGNPPCPAAADRERSPTLRVARGSGGDRERSPTAAGILADASCRSGKGATRRCRPARERGAGGAGGAGL